MSDNEKILNLDKKNQLRKVKTDKESKKKFEKFLEDQHKKNKSDRKPLTSIKSTFKLENKIEASEKETNSLTDRALGLLQLNRLKTIFGKKDPAVEDQEETKLNNHSVLVSNSILAIERKLHVDSTRKSEKLYQDREDDVDAKVNRDLALKRLESDRSKLSELSADKRTLSTNKLLKSLLEKTTLIKDYNLQINNTFQRKSLELQYKQFFIAKDLLHVMKETALTQNEQLNAIVKNTGLPDILKVRQKELAQFEMLKSLRGFLGRKLIEEGGLLRAFGTNFKSQMELLKGHKDRYFHDLTRRSIDAGKYKERGYQIESGKDINFRNKSLNFLANKVFNTDKRRALLLNIKNFQENPSEFLEERRAAIKPTTKKERFYQEMLRVGSNLTNKNMSLIEANVSKESLDADAVFDGRTKTSINQVIPGYLRKIHAEISALRARHKGSSKDFELLFNYSNNRFIEPKSLAGFLKDDFRNQMQSSLRKEQTNFKNLLKTYKLDDKSIEEIQEATIAATGTTNRKGFDLFHSDEFKGQLSPATRKKFNRILKNAKKSKTESLDLESIVTGYRGNIPDFHNEIMEYVRTGHGEELESMGLVTYIPYTKSYKLNTEKIREFMFNPEGDPKKNNLLDYKTRFQYEKELQRIMRLSDAEETEKRHDALLQKFSRTNELRNIKSRLSSKKRYNLRKIDKDNVKNAKYGDHSIHYEDPSTFTYEDIDKEQGLTEGKKSGFFKSFWDRHVVTPYERRKKYNDLQNLRKERNKERKENAEGKPSTEEGKSFNLKKMGKNAAVSVIGGVALPVMSLTQMLKSKTQSKTTDLKEKTESKLEEWYEGLDEDNKKKIRRGKRIFGVKLGRIEKKIKAITSEVYDKLDEETKEKIHKQIRITKVSGKRGKKKYNKVKDYIEDQVKQWYDNLDEETKQEIEKSKNTTIDKATSLFNDTKKKVETGKDALKTKSQEFYDNLDDDTKKKIKRTKKKTGVKVERSKRNLKSLWGKLNPFTTKKENKISDEIAPGMFVLDEEYGLVQMEDPYGNLERYLNEERKKEKEEKEKKKKSFNIFRKKDKEPTKSELKKIIKNPEKAMLSGTISLSFLPAVMIYDGLKHVFGKKDEKQSEKKTVRNFFKFSKNRDLSSNSAKELKEKAEKEGSKGFRLGLLKTKTKWVNGKKVDQPDIPKNEKEAKKKGFSMNGILWSILSTLGQMLLFTEPISAIASMLGALGGPLKFLMNMVKGGAYVAKKAGGAALKVAGGAAVLAGKAAWNFVTGKDPVTKALDKGSKKAGKGLIRKLLSGIKKVISAIGKPILKRVGGKLGKKLVGKLTAKLALRLIPGVGLPLLAYEAYKVYSIMKNEGLGFNSAVCKAIFGFDPWNYEEPILDEDGHPVKTKDIEEEEQSLEEKNKNKEEESKEIELSDEDKEQIEIYDRKNKENNAGKTTTYTGPQVEGERKDRNLSPTEIKDGDPIYGRKNKNPDFENTRLNHPALRDPTRQQLLNQAGSAYDARPTYGPDRTPLQNPSYNQDYNVTIDNSRLERSFADALQIHKDILKENKNTNKNLETIIQLMKKENIEKEKKKETPPQNNAVSQVPQPMISVNRQSENNYLTKTS